MCSIILGRRRGRNNSLETNTNTKRGENMNAEINKPLTTLLYNRECPFSYCCLSSDCLECLKLHTEGNCEKKKEDLMKKTTEKEE